VWLPPAFGLKKWHFAAGAYQLDFAGPGRRLTLYRFAPAVVILKTQSLDQLALKLVPGCAPEKAGQWHLDRKGPARWLGRLAGRQDWQCRLRLWHLADANRILGVALKGAGISPAEMDRICEAYHCVFP
jgi:hypothetical protein